MPPAALAVAPLLVVALTSGCIFPFCGSPAYFLSGVTASATFTDEPWNTTHAEAGIAAAGLQPRTQTDLLVSGFNDTIHMGANDHGAATRLYVSYPVHANGTSQDDVQRVADEAIAQREAHAAALMSAFERGANWTLDTPMTWDAGIGHGDC